MIFGILPLVLSRHHYKKGDPRIPFQLFMPIAYSCVKGEAPLEGGASSAQSGRSTPQQLQSAMTHHRRPDRLPGRPRQEW